MNCNPASNVRRFIRKFSRCKWTCTRRERVRRWWFQITTPLSQSCPFYHSVTSEIYPRRACWQRFCDSINSLSGLAFFNTTHWQFSLWDVPATSASSSLATVHWSSQPTPLSEPSSMSSKSRSSAPLFRFFFSLRFPSPLHVPFWSTTVCDAFSLPFLKSRSLPRPILHRSSFYLWVLTALVDRKVSYVLVVVTIIVDSGRFPFF